jgi:hypothetical protein
VRRTFQLSTQQITRKTLVGVFTIVYIPNFLFINLFTPRNAPDKANRASRLVQHRRRFAL